jgi:hypothetical protein
MIRPKYPNFPDNYIPILVRLRYNFNNVYDQPNLDMVLDQVSSALGTNHINIIVFLAGLDEYRGTVQNEINIVYEKSKQFPNIKFVITSRMEAGFTQGLQIEEYIRLLRFDNQQVEKYLSNYSLQYKFDEIIKIGF